MNSWRCLFCQLEAKLGTLFSTRGTLRDLVPAMSVDAAVSRLRIGKNLRFRPGLNTLVGFKLNVTTFLGFRGVPP